MFYRIFIGPRKRIGRVRVRRRVRRARKAPHRRDYLARKEAARMLAAERLAHFQAVYAALPAPLGLDLAAALQYKRLAIRNTISRWGSCSSRKNINFSYKILDLSPELRDYVVVHELCHLKELHHGAAFWDLMEIAVPRAREFHTQARSMRIS